tara:strand:- start:686 stop:1708 length:1023 start_codon:yes stop_codon:yes gene_type:complete
MIDYFILLLIPLIAFVSRSFLLKKKKLVNLSGDLHQKFTNQKKVPLVGGLLIFTSFSYLYLFDLDLKFYFFLILTFFLGLASDLKIFKSAFLKLLIQIFIIFLMVKYTDLQLSSIGINFIDYLNQDIYFNYLFVSFCIVIIINGSNFIDGMNGLSLGYFIIILLILVQNKLFLSEFNLNYIFIASLIIILLLNFKSLLFLGDNGSYLLGILISYILIETYNQNTMSPFFIALLLWYPSFELLFSILRKFNFNKSPMAPDTNHLHQLIYLFILKRIVKNAVKSNNLTSFIINFYNLSIFFIGSLNYNNSEMQISLILLSVLFYIIVYRNLIAWKVKSVVPK